MPFRQRSGRCGNSLAPATTSTIWCAISCFPIRTNQSRFSEAGIRSDAGRSFQISAASDCALQWIWAGQGRIDILLEHAPSIEPGTFQLMDHAHQIHCALTEFTEDTAADCVE